MKENKYLWWQKGITYQIYPRSYQDSNQDGIGDLPGIIQHLDYIQSLNVDVVWLSPIYPSPMHDFGYDVANYVDIHPLFGNLTDFDRLLHEIHARDMKLILDLVPNHTSDEHEWFIESRSSRDNPKRDWYIWRDPAPDGGPPNNWLSYFGGPAWSFDKATGQYYMHQFVTQQPELNYRHPDVLPAMLDVMRFWLDRGVDGFRVDVIWLMMKDPAFRDEPLNPDWDGVNPHDRLQHIYTQDLPDVHDLIRMMRSLLDSYDKRMMVGEIYLPYERLLTYYGRNHDECHLPFNFHLIHTPWQATAVKATVDSYETMLPKGAWPNWVLGNHDQHRVATRVGHNQARIANMLLLTLRGMPTTYYGEEIGMENGHIPPESVQDPPAINQPEIAHIIGRDPARTPMQWRNSPHAGFTSATTAWLPVAANYTTCNVAAQEKEPTSMLTFYRALTQLRRQEPSLHVGDYIAIDSGNDAIFAYQRSAPKATPFLIVLNFTGEPQSVNLAHVAANGRVVLTTDLQSGTPVTLSDLILAPNQGILIAI